MYDGKQKKTTEKRMKNEHLCLQKITEHIKDNLINYAIHFTKKFNVCM